MITKKQLKIKIRELEAEILKLQGQIAKPSPTSEICQKCKHGIKVTSHNDLLPVTTYMCELHCNCKNFDKIEEIDE